MWCVSRCYLGAFLMIRHFFIVSTSSGALQNIHLKSNKSKESVASLSPFIALSVTKDRAIGFDAMANQLINSQLPIHSDQNR